MSESNGAMTPARNAVLLAVIEEALSKCEVAFPVEASIAVYDALAARGTLATAQRPSGRMAWPPHRFAPFANPKENKSCVKCGRMADDQLHVAE